MMTMMMNITKRKKISLNMLKFPKKSKRIEPTNKVYEKKNSKIFLVDIFAQSNNQEADESLS